MALPRKARPIVVDGVDYRWMTTDRDDRCPGFVATLAVESGCLLLWTRSAGRPDITPALVAAGIRAARSQGWRAAEPGPPFRLLDGERHPPVGRPDGLTL